jgi:hypothetical protein
LMRMNRATLSWGFLQESARQTMRVSKMMKRLVLLRVEVQGWHFACWLLELD